MFDSLQGFATEQGVDERSTSSFSQLIHGDHLVYGPYLPSFVFPSIFIVTTEVPEGSARFSRHTSRVASLLLEASQLHSGGAYRLGRLRYQ